MLPKKCEFISFDVRSLFISISTQEVLTILKTKVDNNHLTDINRINLVKFWESFLNRISLNTMANFSNKPMIHRWRAQKDQFQVEYSCSTLMIYYFPRHPMIT